MKRKLVQVVLVFALIRAFTGSVVADDSTKTVGYYMKTQTALNGRIGSWG
jgi:hypothetical protein